MNYTVVVDEADFEVLSLGAGELDVPGVSPLAVDDLEAPDLKVDVSGCRSREWEVYT